MLTPQNLIRNFVDRNLLRLISPLAKSNILMTPMQFDGWFRVRSYVLLRFSSSSRHALQAPSLTGAIRMGGDFHLRSGTTLRHTRMLLEYGHLALDLESVHRMRVTWIVYEQDLSKVWGLVYEIKRCWVTRGEIFVRCEFISSKNIGLKVLS